MVINIKATNMDLTPAIRDYINKKIESLLKFFPNITQADVDVGLVSHHHNKGKVYYAEVNLFIPRKNLRVRKETEDLYKAIDKVKDHLKKELSEINDKNHNRNKQALRNAKGYNI